MLNYELINKLHNTSGELINRNDLSVKTTELLNKLLETLKIMENCVSCKYKKICGNDLYKLYKSINEMENCLVKLEKEEQEKKEDIIDELNKELLRTDNELNKELLCEGCREEIKKLTDKCENEKIARSLYGCKLNKIYCDYWIPFDEFKNIKYLAKGSFGEIHKATCVRVIF